MNPVIPDIQDASERKIRDKLKYEMKQKGIADLRNLAEIEFTCATQPEPPKGGTHAKFWLNLIWKANPKPL